MSLIDTLKNYITPEVIGMLSGMLGEKNQTVRGAVDAGIPALLSGMLSKSATGKGADELFNVIQGGSFEPSMLSNITSLLGDSTSSSNLLQSGMSMLGTIFGNNQKVEGVSNAISQMSGLSQDSSSKVLGMLAPMAMGLLGSKSTSASGLASLLAGEKSSILGALPAGISGLLGFNATSAAKSVGNATSQVASNAAATGGSMFRWLLPFLLIGALGFLAWSMMKGCNNPVTNSVTSAVENTTNAAGNAANAVGNAAGNAANAAGNAAGNAVNGVVSAADTLAGAAGAAGSAVAGATGDALATLGNFFKRKLSTGVELNIPEKGIENNLITWLDDTNSVVTKETWFNFDRLLFDTGKSTLKPESAEQVKNMTEILKAYPNVKIKLGGYTDNVGADAGNLRLSDARAKAVMAELTKAGIAADRVAAEGYGEQHPVCAANDTETCRAQNRRIAVRVTAK